MGTLELRLAAAARRLGVSIAALKTEVLEVWLLDHEKAYSGKVGKYD